MKAIASAAAIGRWLLRASVPGLALVLAACAGYGGSKLQPGVATLPEIVASMGQPAMRWQDPDGRQQLAYPRGPAGLQTFMVFVAPDGRLERIEGVLDNAHFARIVPGRTSQAEVLRLLGPPPQRTMYFPARDELAWEWRICDSMGQQAFFNVLFDGMNGPVRTTMQRPDYSGWDGIVPFCGH